jgi:hypothetical protein
MISSGGGGSGLSRSLFVIITLLLLPFLIHSSNSFPLIIPQSPSPSSHSRSLTKRSLTERKQPVLGPIPLNGTKPIFGHHKGTDAIFALACKYPVSFYRRFVGSLRKFGYKDDIVLAVSPPEQMKPGVEDYVKKTEVVAYGFDVNCAGKDNCRLKDDFLGYLSSPDPLSPKNRYEDPRPMRTFANIRYALYGHLFPPKASPLIANSRHLRVLAAILF